MIIKSKLKLDYKLKSDISSILVFHNMKWKQNKILNLLFISAYVSDLLKLLCEEVVPQPATFQETWQEVLVPDSLSSQFEQPDKEEAVASYSSRPSRYCKSILLKSNVQPR